MRRALLSVVLLSLTTADTGALAPPAGPVTPDTHLWLAVKHLRRVPAHDRCFIRYASFLSLQYHKNAAVFQRAQVWWHNNLSGEQHPAYPGPVPGSGGLLWALDIREYRWNVRGWRVVARRDTYFREPWVDPVAAKLLRELADVEHEVIKETGEVPVIVVVRADLLFRRTLEPVRGRKGDDSYYDLLYAFRRFPDGKEAIDFPRNLDDWNDFYGVKAVTDFADKARIDTRVGAIVAGSRDDPTSGSLVARQNRVAQFLQAPWGVHLRTFDALETAGETDYVERPADVARGKVKADAGEFLGPLPNGAQGMALFAFQDDPKGKRVEFADGRLTHPKFPKEERRQPHVVTGQCWVCHMVEGGIITPRDQFTRNDKVGIKARVLSKDDELRIKGFFAKWERRMKGWRDPYFALIEETTKGSDGKPLAPAVLMATLIEYRDWYDNPVSPDQAALEMGVDVLTLRVALAADIKRYEADGSYKVVNGFARLKELSKGLSIPRETWELDVFRYASLSVRLYRESKVKR